MQTTVIVELKIQNKKINDFLKKSKIVIEQSNQEKGCLEYNLFKEVSSENIFIFKEKYRNKESFEFHQKTSHFKQFFNYVSSILVEEPIINIY